MMLATLFSVCMGVHQSSASETSSVPESSSEYESSWKQRHRCWSNYTPYALLYLSLYEGVSMLYFSFNYHKKVINILIKFNESVLKKCIIFLMFFKWILEMLFHM